MENPFYQLWKTSSLVILTFLIAYLPAVAEAGNVRLRAREHFEWLSIKYGAVNDTERYFGLTNTINLWYEEPFQYALGLAFGPVIGSAKSRDSAPTGTDSKVRLWNIGFEGKYFFFPDKHGLFGRIGLTANILDTRGSLGNLLGGGYYLGVGWEARIWKLGVAPELAFRHVILEQSSQLFAFTPSIGLHFYVLPKNSQESKD
ncbi:MAG TPA: hypothetical protein VGB26_00510 [Nitrospiria bacterium]|jgi:hypothetical protein